MSESGTNDQQSPGNGESRAQKLANNATLTLAFRGLTATFMVLVMGIGIPTLTSGASALITLRSDMAQVPLKIEVVNGQIALLKSDLSGKQMASDMRMNQQGEDLSAIRLRLAEISKDLTQLQIQYGALSAELKGLTDMNRGGAAPIRR